MVTTLATHEMGIDPYSSLHFHFGMLLGVEDFEVEQSYHRGKTWLHTGWLHGAGAVWGLEVRRNLDAAAPQNDRPNEIRVEPGLAVDGHGRELYLDRPACIDLGEWYVEHQGEEVFGFAVAPAGGEVTFDARVVIKFGACLERPVPAISEDCTNAAVSTAYSRHRELPGLVLVPAAPDEGPDPHDPAPAPDYHLLRLFFGLEDADTDEAGDPLPEDQAVLDELAALAGLAPEDVAPARLAAFRRVAALATMGHEPAAGELFPVDGAAGVVLAELTGVQLQGNDDDGWNVAAIGGIDNLVRPAHVATRTIQELLTGAPGGGSLRVDRAGVRRVAPDRLALPLAGRALDGSEADAVEVSRWRDGAVPGWQVLAVVPSLVDGADRQELSVAVKPAPADTDWVRIIVRGTGPTPLLAVNHRPLAGAVGGPPASPFDGNDFVHMAQAAALD